MADDEVTPAVRWARTAAEVALGAALGLGALALGALRPAGTPAPKSAMDGLSLLSLGAVFAAGLLLGVVGSLRPVVAGLWTMALAPIGIVRDVVADPTSHNLWPFELVGYGALAMLAAGGAFMGRRLRALVAPPSADAAADEADGDPPSG